MAGEIERKRNKMDDGPEMRTKLEDDRLSSLPDEIIHHILSFIDTKCAVQTCVLSSRWKLIWTSLPHLNLDSSRFRILPKFSKFVNRVLSHRNKFIEVSTVDIYFRGPIRQKFLEKILSYATSHNVHELKIRFETQKVDDQLPSCLFKSESLKHLSLSAQLSHLNVFPCPRSPWNVPALTTLVLKNIWLCYEASGLDLFSKCVNLKNLTLDNCRAWSLGVMQIFCPQLVNLTLKHGCTSKYALLTPNLSYLYYRGDSEVSFSTDGLLCLDIVNLEMSRMSESLCLDDRQRDAHRLLTFLQELRNAKNLSVSSYFIEFLSTVPDILEQQPSPFSKLKCLKIKFYSMRKSTNAAMIDRVIKYLFNSSSSFNVIMELPEDLSYQLYLARGNGVGFSRTIAAHRRDMQALCKVAEMLSLQEMSDPRISQLLEDVKKKLAAHCQELGIRLPRQSK